MFSYNFNRTQLLLAASITIMTIAVYFQIVWHDFINYDDVDYITQNLFIKNGLTSEGLRWAFTTTHTGNWHPLTWLTHMLDVQLYGFKPGGHHLTNLILHIANTLLLFRFLIMSTGATWRSGIVAFLFALHPLHVESVAWAAERKDVLSALFFMVTLNAYYAYVQRPSLARYLKTLGAFILGLLAKPMLVSLPLILFFLDYWPLNRLLAVVPSADTTDRGLQPAVPLPWLILEKLPFAILALASCLVTLYAQVQENSVASLEAVPLFERIQNAIVACGGYLAKMVWPIDLAVFYPLQPISPIKFFLATAIIVGISLTAVWGYKQRPYLIMGWLWYLVMLLPVIGIVQVGFQSMADRYTYLPLVGVFIMLVWTGCEFLTRLRFPPRIIIVSLCLILISLASRCADQIRLWSDNMTLFSHAAAVTKNNYVAESQLGFTYYVLGNYNEAINHYQRAYSPNINAGIDKAQLDMSMGGALAAVGRIDEAIDYYLRAIQRKPNSAPEAYKQLGRLLQGKGELAEAIRYYRNAVNLEPNDAEARELLMEVEGGVVD